jgi:succinyl-CoA synthetase alpha subunit
MSIWLDSSSKIVVQGITGKNGQFHSEQMLDYGTRIIGGVTPGKGGQETLGLPIWDTMDEAVDAGANVSCIFVPPAFAADAIMEAADSNVDLIVAITEGIPALDMVKVKKYIEPIDVRLIGPNCPGIITPGKSKVGIMPGQLGPIRRTSIGSMYFFTLTMSSAGIPSVIATIKSTFESAASMMASAAKAGGTNIQDTFAPASTASSMVSHIVDPEFPDHPCQG